ncbi:MAG TPA: hypothetical protein VFW06_07375 [Acidimicrobiia bacterium]|nr:hypothetical protein [Acidimicrobiia bacterium]
MTPAAAGSSAKSAMTSLYAVHRVFAYSAAGTFFALLATVAPAPA